MKTISMPLAMAVAMWIAVFHPYRCGAADEVVAFGLTNRSINSASISLDHEYRGVLVQDLSEFGHRGLSVRLGQVDSGLFFSPFTRRSLENDNFMVGHAYGRVGGIERRISSVFCRRREYATYPITIDFLPLGALRKTVQVFNENVLIGQESYTSGEIIVSTSNDSYIGPRVNPCWRMPDGSIGVLLEFSTFPPITLPSGRSTYANRLFVRADDPLFTVDYVSRVDVYGGGGLADFSAIDERIGMFGRAHRALGEAVFSAKKNKLTVANCRDAGTDGVMIDLENVPAFSASFQPVSLAGTGAVFRVSASSTYDRYHYWLPSIYFGPIGIENHEGEKRLRFDFSSVGAFATRIEAFDGAMRVGELATAGAGEVSLGTNNVAIVSAGVLGGEGSSSAALLLELREPATLTLEERSLTGKTFRLSAVNPTNDIGTFAGFHLLACGTPFTITNETATAAPPILLGIEQAGTNVIVSWPGIAAGYTYLEANGDLRPTSPWWYVSWQEWTSYRSRVRVSFPMDQAGSGFFRLHNPYAQIYPPYTPGD